MGRVTSRLRLHTRLRRCAAVAALAATLAVGAGACGSSDNGGVIQGPTTTAAKSNSPGY
jgi:hypothetical protein